ncbi:GNAT family N-acetyltransferase [Bradyrhizobium monzae]|uniref:GNAT family N-acetyltransferase n=1 Tax=Bradyrhizobium sp. Oc8 TaxID=2876780 RepID=UPI001F365F30|nr:GNAT family N-acetyltransferase [Bradyrhizobium sp. Oc8]
MSRFEIPLGDSALAVAYYKVEDGRVVLLHTEVPQELSDLGYGSRLAHGVLEALRRDRKRVIAKCPFMSCYAARHPSKAHSSTADRRRTGRRRAQRLWTTIPHAYRMHIQREFLISSAASDLGVARPTEHTRSAPQRLKQ